MTANTQPERARAVIVLGLPRAHVSFLRREAARRETRPSVVVEELLDRELSRRGAADEPTPQGPMR